MGHNIDWSYHSILEGAGHFSYFKVRIPVLFTGDIVCVM
jgi:hypothetical protein